MSTKAGALGIERGTAGQWRDWLMVVVASMAAASLVMAVMALRQGAGTGAVPAPAAVAPAFAQQGIYERSAPVTGTGPALATLAEAQRFVRLYQDSAPVTGTGPGLIEIARRSAEQRKVPVTGTGPGLSFVGQKG